MQCFALCRRVERHPYLEAALSVGRWHQPGCQAVAEGDPMHLEQLPRRRGGHSGSRRRRCPGAARDGGGSAAQDALPKSVDGHRLPRSPPILGTVGPALRRRLLPEGLASDQRPRPYRRSRRVSSVFTARQPREPLLGCCAYAGDGSSSVVVADRIRRAVRHGARAPGGCLSATTGRSVGWLPLLRRLLRPGGFGT